MRSMTRLRLRKASNALNKPLAVSHRGHDAPLNWNPHKNREAGKEGRAHLPQQNNRNGGGKYSILAAPDIPIGVNQQSLITSVSAKHRPANLPGRRPTLPAFRAPAQD
jgi:hypothetical protein